MRGPQPSGEVRNDSTRLIHRERDNQSAQITRESTPVVPASEEGEGDDPEGDSTQKLAYLPSGHGVSFVRSSRRSAAKQTRLSERIYSAQKRQTSMRRNAFAGACPLTPMG